MCFPIAKRLFRDYVSPDVTKHEKHLLEQIHEQNKLIMSELANLQAAVAANTTATNAAVAALQNPATGTPDSALVPLTTAITANNAALTAATPAPAPAAPAA